MALSKNELSHEAYRRVRRSRRWNTFSAVVVVSIIGGAVFFHLHLEFTVNLTWSLMVFVASLLGLAFMGDLVKYVGHKGQPRCPQCEELIESGKLIDHKFPTSCSHCGLEIIPEER